MSSQYTREQLKLSTAKMCLTIGWHNTMTTPIELLADILCNYLGQLGKLTNDYANGFGRSEAGIEHLALAFRDLGVNLQDLSEFVRNVECPEYQVAVPQYPVHKEDNLNFLKPGSQEVITRQVHIHEYLPPMFPQLEEQQRALQESSKTESGEEDNAVQNTHDVFKRPAEISHDIFKRPRTLNEEELGRPTREISSVIMTTSGFLSPAREGRLPEARTPDIVLEPPAPLLSPEQVESVKKPIKSIKKSDKFRDTHDHELFKPNKEHQPPKEYYKHSTVKNLVRNKMKHREHSHAPPTPTLPIKNYMVVNDSKPDITTHIKKPHDNQIKFNTALAAARMKTEKFNTTITPIPTRNIPATIVKPEPLVDKLFTEPDKKKVNILRKISVKPDRADRNYKGKEEHKIPSTGNLSNVIIDEPVSAVSSQPNFPKDITVELVPTQSISVASNPTILAKKSPEKNDKFEKYYFDDYSPPGTPSTPRTPEMISHSPPMPKSEKHKSKSKNRKIQKYPSPPALDIDVLDMEMERPKTPDSNIILKAEKRQHPAVPPMNFPFFTGFSGPGLIPTPLTNPLFPHLPISSLGLSNFPQPPYMPSKHNPMPMNFMPPVHPPVLPSSTITSPLPAYIPTSTPPFAPASLDSPTSTVTSTTFTKEEKYEVQPCSSTSTERVPPLKLLTDSLSSMANEKKKIKKDKKRNKKDKHKSEKRKLKEEKKEKSRMKKEKREKKKNKGHNGSTSPVPKFTLKVPPKTKLNIKAIVKPEDKLELEPQASTSSTPNYILEREMSPELARFSALVTGQPKSRNHTAVSSTREEEGVPQAGPSRRPGRPRIHPIRQRPTTGNDSRRTTEQEPSEDCEGNKIWICPGCGVQDDGSPMIGCDDCDAWYHWVCVGIQIPPDENEDWYCRHCIERNRNMPKREKKKKRKGKDKKGHKY